MDNNQVQQKTQDIIDNLKSQQFQKFLVIKLEFQQLNHKKIVQNIYNNYFLTEIYINKNFISQILENSNNLKYLYKYLKYIPSFSSLYFDFFLIQLKDNQFLLQFSKGLQTHLPKHLLSFQLSSQYSSLGIDYEKSIQYLSKGLSKLPINLKNIEVDLSFNYMSQNFRYFCQTFLQNLPPNLLSLSLILMSNFIGKDQYDISYLFQTGLQNLPPSLTKLSLNLSQNNIGIIPKNLLIISDWIKNLPHHLTDLSLDFQCNQIGDKSDQYLPNLFEAFKFLPPNLINLDIDFSNNHLGKNIKSLIQSLQNLPKQLKKIYLYLSFIDIQQVKDSFELFYSIVKHIPVSLQALWIDISNNHVESQPEQLQYIGKIFETLPPNLKELVFKLENCYKISDNNIKQTNQVFQQHLVKGLSSLPDSLVYLELSLKNLNIDKQTAKQIAQKLSYWANDEKYPKLKRREKELYIEDCNDIENNVKSIETNILDIQ